MWNYRYFSSLIIISIIVLILFRVETVYFIIPVAVHVLISFAMSFPIRANFYLKSIHKGLDNNEKTISLTFDDGPNEKTAIILDILKKYNVKATFFLVGENIIKHQKLVERINNEGHIIGNHSWNHSYSLTIIPSAMVKKNLQKNNRLIADIIGKSPLYFRPPAGITNPGSAKAIKHLGMHSIGWSIRSYDTVIKDVEKCLNRIISKISGNDILLLHDTCKYAEPLLNKLLPWLSENGIKVVPIDEHIKLNAYDKL